MNKKNAVEEIVEKVLCDADRNLDAAILALEDGADVGLDELEKIIRNNADYAQLIDEKKDPCGYDLINFVRLVVQSIVVKEKIAEKYFQTND